MSGFGLGDLEISLVSECQYLGITINEKNFDLAGHTWTNEKNLL